MQYKKPFVKKDTSWKASSDWYDSLVGDTGHFYHRELIFPWLMPHLHLKKEDSLLDLGCGQGVLSRQIPEIMLYTGIDFAKPLLTQAKNYAKANKKSNHEFIHHDLTVTPWPLDKDKKNFYSNIVSILALQNMKEPMIVLKEAAHYLKPNGSMILILNHPCFRIPRKSRWGFDEATKTQTRELFSYMTPQEIPITTHPGKEAIGQQSDKTWSYHFPLSTWSSYIAQAGLIIKGIEELVSPKVSIGKNARSENRAREEFPLFLTFILTKV